jgi:hypothetical protein
MAWWYFARGNKTLILAPKCASTSMRQALEPFQTWDKYNRNQHAVAICVRDPIERFYSGMSCDSTPGAMRRKHQDMDGLLHDLMDKRKIHSHFCRQVDYLNFRWIDRKGGTHAWVPWGEDRLRFTPELVVRYEHLAEDWPRLLDWLELPPPGEPDIILPHAKKAVQPFPRRLDATLEKIYAADYRMLEELRKMDSGVPCGYRPGCSDRHHAPA